jgi:hypothetical protein
MKTARPYPDAYLRYLEEFHKTRDFFECHEILEEHWKTDPDGLRSGLWVGLIQLAVGLYHQRRGNARGALKMLRGARGKLAGSDPAAVGIDGDALLAALDERIRELEEHPAAPYRDLDIPLLDAALAPLTQPAVDSRTLGAAVTERHRLRDRSDVVAARRAALEAKNRADRRK